MCIKADLIHMVSSMFAEEKPHLQALPLEPFRFYQYGERTVRLPSPGRIAAYMPAKTSPGLFPETAAPVLCVKGSKRTMNCGLLPTES